MIILPEISLAGECEEIGEDLMSPKLDIAPMGLVVYSDCVVVAGAGAIEPEVLEVLSLDLGSGLVSGPESSPSLSGMSSLIESMEIGEEHEEIASRGGVGEAILTTCDIVLVSPLVLLGVNEVSDF